VVSERKLVKKCCVCKKILRGGVWLHVEDHDDSKIPTSHGYCDWCAKKTIEEYGRARMKENFKKLGKG
jgi:hypothetical protein